MSAAGSFRDYVSYPERASAWQHASCTCGGQLISRRRGDECQGMILLSKISPLGQLSYQATCVTSANTGVCHKPHAFVCDKCDFSILID